MLKKATALPALVLIALTGFSGVSIAQFNCLANGGVTPARSEGISEPEGDLVVVCFNGTPTAPGAPVPAADIQVLLNTGLTSRLLAGSWSEALLLIDDPLPQAQRVCGSPGDTETSPGVCAITGSGTGVGVYNGTSGHPNVFQGFQSAPNAITFPGVPIDPPGTSGSRVIRVTNIRANAFALGVAGPNATPTPITETISATPPQVLPISNTASQAVAFVLRGMTPSFSAAPSFSQCASQNKSLADDPSQSGVSQFNVSFSENFATAFKRRNVATTSGNPAVLANQNDLLVGTYNTETGFYNSSFPAISGRGNLGVAGLADQGTRLFVYFQDIPAGIKLFSQILPPFTNGPDVIRMTGTDSVGGGAFSPVAGNPSGIAPIPLTGGSGTAVYEVIQSDPNTFATVHIPIYAAYDATAGLPALGTGVVFPSLAPGALVLNADTSSPVPRFALPFSGSNVFTVNACACASDMSANISVMRGGFSFNFGTGRFQQLVTIRNIGANPIAGPISLALDSLSSNATLVNAAGVTSCAGPAGSPLIGVNVGSVLYPGASARVALQFTRTGSAGITYNTRVLGGSGGR